MKTLFAFIFVLLSGSVVIYYGTDQLNALTAESARRYGAIHNPKPVAPVMFTTHTGEVVEYFSGKNEIIVVDFVFTYCPTVCQMLGASFYRLQEAVRSKGIENQVKFLSVSFDLAVDDVPELAAFADRHKADPAIWRVARPQNDQDLNYLLKTFGVVVLDDPLFRFVHNAGLHVVSPDRRLIAILNADDVEGALELLEASL